MEQYPLISQHDLAFKTPTSLLVVGESNAGKTEFAINAMCTRPEFLCANEVVIVYRNPQPIYSRLKTAFGDDNVRTLRMSEGLDMGQVDEMIHLDDRNRTSPLLNLLIDDNSVELLQKSDEMFNYLTSHMRHKKINIFLLGG